MAMAAREEIRVGAVGIRFLLEGAETGGAVSVFEFDVPAGARVPLPHSHDGYEETIVGLTGTLTWLVDGMPARTGPGEALCIPRGAVHHFENQGDDDATALAVVTPGVLGPDYFRELAALLAAAAPGPPEPAEIAAVMRRHGLSPVQPEAAS
jgi:quercetin dioxygenase-like cupin family protein